MYFMKSVALAILWYFVLYWTQTEQRKGEAWERGYRVWPRKVLTSIAVDFNYVLCEICSPSYSLLLCTEVELSAEKPVIYVDIVVDI